MDTLFMTESVVEPNAIENGDIRSFGVRAFSGGLFAFSTALDGFVTGDFEFAQPIDTMDGVKGGICAVSGMWAPNHVLVKTDQGRCIPKWAGKPKPRRYR